MSHLLEFVKRRMDSRLKLLKVKPETIVNLIRSDLEKGVETSEILYKYFFFAIRDDKNEMEPTLKDFACEYLELFEDEFQEALDADENED